MPSIAPHINRLSSPDQREYFANLRYFGYELPQTTHGMTGQRLLENLSDEMISKSESYSQKFNKSLSDEFTTCKDYFKHGNFMLRSNKLIAINWSRGEELWFAENEEMDVYATGLTQEEALREFQFLVVHFYLHYEKLPENKVVCEALRLRKLYLDTFVKVSL